MQYWLSNTPTCTGGKETKREKEDFLSGIVTMEQRSDQSLPVEFYDVKYDLCLPDCSTKALQNLKCSTQDRKLHLCAYTYYTSGEALSSGIDVS